MKLLIFNVVTALITLTGLFLHITDNAATTTKLFFYPIYAYTLLSFITSAIAIVYGGLDLERGNREAKAGIWAHVGYIVALLIGVAAVWSLR
ncbi:MAG: hypothetical protein GXO33_08830 [Epsilonproteobacteria bacterium]|nr:hypothetical protein [Campylobacterota bacterium]